MLQNKKYVKFAGENTVEVVSMGNIEAGTQDGDKRLETFKAKDGKQYLVGWPNLTLEQLKSMRVPRTYKDGNGIPETAIVNPHTLEKMDSWKSSYAAGKLTDAVTAAKKTLNKQYGKSVSRKTLRKIQKDADKVRAELEQGGVAKAMTAARALEKKVARKPKAIQDMAATLIEEILKAAGERLDGLEALISGGDRKGAARTLGPLARALKGTPLEQRTNDLLARAKVE